MKRPATLPVVLMKIPDMSFARESSYARPTFASHNSVVLNYMERGWIRSLLATGFRYELKTGRPGGFLGRGAAQGRGI